MTLVFVSSRFGRCLGLGVLSLAFTIFAPVLFSSCAPKPIAEPTPSFANTPVTLLFVPPLIGAEKAVRTPVPEAERMTINEESVIGWVSPPEKNLTFPISLREGAHLSFRVGIATDNAVKNGDIVAIAEYEPFDIVDRGHGAKRELYRSEFRSDANWPHKWQDVEVDLTGIPPGHSLLRFRAEGSLATDPNVTLMWGQPTVFYPAERKHRNVLLIGVDTLRRDALSAFGGRVEVTPNLQRLAESGTAFDRAWSQAPFTVPSFASMLTGRFPADLSPTLATETLPLSADTLAETLLQNGFATSMICGNVYIGNDKSGFDQGVEGNWFRVNATPPDSVEKAKEFMDRSTDRDWFLFLHFMDPHGPYDPPQEFIDKLCDPSYRGKYKTAFEDGLPWQLATSIPPEKEIRRARELYDAEVADVDAAVGDLFAYLDDNGLLNETLIIIAADHGEEFFEHGQFEHGQSVYEEMVHLPLIVWGPDFPQGSHIDTPVGNIDIAPTILKFTGLRVPDDFPGSPLTNVIAGDFNKDRSIFGEGNLRRGSHAKFAVDWPYKCIVDFFTGEVSLYDFSADPGEKSDVSERYPLITEALSSKTRLAMVPLQTTFILTIIGDSKDGPAGFSGTVRIPGGIAFAAATGTSDSDSYSAEGDTIRFDFSSATTIEEPAKALIILPAPGGDTIEVSVLADGKVDPGRFYPYASSAPEPSGSATVKVSDLPWPNRIPADVRARPVALYVMGIPGFPRGETGAFENVELDPEVREQLRALGYVN